MRSVADLVKIERPKVSQPFLIYGQYVGQEEQSLKRDYDICISEGEVKVFPGSFIYAYGTTNIDDYMFVFSSQNVFNPGEKPTYYGIATIGDEELFLGRDDTATVEKINPIENYNLLFESVKNRSSYYHDWMQDEVKSHSEYTQILNEIAKKPIRGSSNGWEKLSSQRLKEMYSAAKTHEAYENMTFFKMLIDTKK